MPGGVAQVVTGHSSSLCRHAIRPGNFIVSVLISYLDHMTCHNLLSASKWTHSPHSDRLLLLRLLDTSTWHLFFSGRREGKKVFTRRRATLSSSSSSSSRLAPGPLSHSHTENVFTTKTTSNPHSL